VKGRLALKLDTDSTGDLKILVLQNIFFSLLRRIPLLIILRKYNRQKDKISIFMFLLLLN
jgi:phage FluMu gp28-like protein